MVYFQFGCTVVFYLHNYAAGIQPVYLQIVLNTQKTPCLKQTTP